MNSDDISKGNFSLYIVVYFALHIASYYLFFTRLHLQDLQHLISRVFALFFYCLHVAIYVHIVKINQKQQTVAILHKGLP